MSAGRVGCLAGWGLGACLLVAVVLARGRLLPAAAAWLDVGGPPERADAVLVLLGDPDTRAMTAAALVRGGWAPRVLLNTFAPTEQDQRGIVLPGHEIHRRMLLRCGVPAADIVLLDNRVHTTYDEVSGLADYLASRPDWRVLVVTDAPHTRRSRWVLRRILGDRASQTSLVSAATDKCRTDCWWQSETGFSFVLSEYLKLGFYAVRYGVAGYVGAAGAALAVAWWAYRRRRRRVPAPSP
ncbi:MAG: YdcF family protein [Thermoguttaceae bacterium]|jgi:uncharacterized SAM-binding protein YcdF (DUF218 family)